MSTSGSRPRLWLLGVVLTVLFAAPVHAQTTDCPPYQGMTCDGWVTDAAGVLEDDDRLEEAVGRLVSRHGHEIAVVLVESTSGQSVEEFATGLGDAWGVGDPQRDDGVVVLVDLEQRQTYVAHGPGLNDVPADWSAIASVADPFFAGGDFDGGVLAILGALDAAFAAAAGPGTDPPDVQPTQPPPADDVSVSPWLVLAVIGVVVVGGLGAGLAVSRRNRREQTRRRRAELVDAELARLETGGHELPVPADFALPPPETFQRVPTGDARRVLASLVERRPVDEAEALNALWALDLVDVIDTERLRQAGEVPLELRASGERAVLEEAVQATAREALEVDPSNEEVFASKLRELAGLVDAVRPHRVAEARRRVTGTIEDLLVPTRIGDVLITDRGERFLGAAPALDPEAPLRRSLDELDRAYREATDKTTRMERLYEQLPDNPARPAVAAALTDLEFSPEQAVRRYERVRTELEERGVQLARDGLENSAVAALLLLNRDELEVDEFIRVYRRNRDGGLEAAEAVEFALAGLSDHQRIQQVREEAERNGLPISIAAALLDRRHDGPEVYADLVESLAAEGVTGDTRRTIAGILAISLEPAQALRRWLETRKALADLGLDGSYADVAAAFGASDPRGPRGFALAYAAQRQALARSTVRDADRFAPELAHRGTRDQTDSWTGQRIPPHLGAFDPYTLFFFHWVMTGGNAGTMGWEPVYRDQSWSGERSTWFGGFGGGGFAGGGGGGSSWGGGGWSPGSFGGFGGGGFGGGGGGGSGW